MPSLKMKQYFEQGQTAAACGKALDDCPYKKPERKNAWVRGFHEAKLMSNLQGQTPVQKRTNQEHIAHLKTMLAGGST